MEDTKEREFTVIEKVVMSLPPTLNNILGLPDVKGFAAMVKSIPDSVITVTTGSTRAGSYQEYFIKCTIPVEVEEKFTYFLEKMLPSKNYKRRLLGLSLINDAVSKVLKTSLNMKNIALDQDAIDEIEAKEYSEAFTYIMSEQFDAGESTGTNSEMISKFVF